MRWVRLTVMMVLLSVAVGCNQKFASSVTTKVSDSTWVTETPRTIDVLIPGYSLGVKRMIECDSITNKPKPFVVEKKEEHASLRTEVTEEGELIADSKCDSLVKQVEVLEQKIHTLRTEKTDTIQPIIQYKTRQIDIVCRWIAGATVLAVGGFTALKFLKPI